MEKMMSGIGSFISAPAENDISHRKSIADNQYYTEVASKVVISGTPGEVDLREFQTDSLKPFTNIQVGNGNLVTNSLGYKTNVKPYKAVDPGRFDGLSPMQGMRPPDNPIPLDFPFTGITLEGDAVNPRLKLVEQIFNPISQPERVINSSNTGVSTQILISKGKY